MIKTIPGGGHIDASLEMFNELKQGVVRQVHDGRLPLVVRDVFTADNVLDFLNVAVEGLEISQLAILLLRAADVQQQLPDLASDVWRLVREHVLAQHEVPFLEKKRKLVIEPLKCFPKQTFSIVRGKEGRGS